MVRSPRIFPSKASIWNSNGGVDNILNRSNFLTYAWMPLLNGHCPKSGKELYQMPIFPNFGIRLVYR